MRIKQYLAEYEKDWDEFVSRSFMATFLHTRRFLSYHGNRFQDHSLVILNDESKMIGLLPAAGDPKISGRVVSHPGLTYGGIIHAGKLKGPRMVEAMNAVCGHYKEAGFEYFRYKPIPHIYHQAPAEDDLYALFRVGAVRYRCDLSSTIDLSHRLKIRKGRKWGIKRAEKIGIEITEGTGQVSQLWEMLAENLEKYSTKPTHSISEIQNLLMLFPDQIKILAAFNKKLLLSGVVLFMTPNVVHTQYIASSKAGRELNALDFLIERTVEWTDRLGVRFFDFGISNEKEGWFLNEGLYKFKSEFGAGGVVYEAYEINLLNKPQGNREKKTNHRR